MIMWLFSFFCGYTYICICLSFSHPTGVWLSSTVSTKGEGSTELYLQVSPSTNIPPREARLWFFKSYSIALSLFVYSQFADIINFLSDVLFNVYILIKLVDQTLIIRTSQYSFHFLVYYQYYIVHSFGEGITTFKYYTQHISLPQDPRMVSFFLFNTTMCIYACLYCINDNNTTVSSAGDLSTNQHQ